MLLRWAWSFSLDQEFNPLQTSAPPCHDLPSQALFDEAMLDNYFAWMEKRAHGVKGGCHSEGKDSKGWQKGESKSGERDGERVWVREKKDQKQAFHFSCLRRLQRGSGTIGPGVSCPLWQLDSADEVNGMNGRVQGLLQDSHNRVCFSPSPPFFRFPLWVARMQLKYFQMKTMWSKVPNLNHGGWWNWRGGRERRRVWELLRRTQTRVCMQIYSILCIFVPYQTIQKRIYFLQKVSPLFNYRLLFEYMKEKKPGKYKKMYIKTWQLPECFRSMDLTDGAVWNWWHSGF